MDDIWNDAAKQFYELCGKSLQSGEVKSFADVRTAIEKSHHDTSSGEEGEKSGWSKAKEIGLQTLDLLQALLGIASNASELLPIPPAAASIACNALVFVFSIPSAIEGYEDAVNGVFAFVHSGLSQFKIFSTIDELRSHHELLPHIQKVMTSFVKLCAHVVKYQQSGTMHRLKQKVKAGLFRSDSGLGEEKINFENMVLRQGQVVEVDTLATVIRTQASQLQQYEATVRFGQITEATYQFVKEIHAQQSKEWSDRDLRTIHTSLGIPSTIGLDSKAPRMYTEAFAKLMDLCQTACSWIWTHDAYKYWIGGGTSDQMRNGSHILLVFGPPSSGKTTVSSLITHHLCSNQTLKGHGRIHVAHYFFSSTGKKFDSEMRTALTPNKKQQGDRSILDDALKFMAFQISCTDPRLQQALSEACASSADAFDDPESLRDLWKALRIGTSGTAATYFLIFDGVENLPQAQAEAFFDFVSSELTGSTNGQIRVLLSGVEDSFTCNKFPEGVSRIKMQDHSLADMTALVGHTLERQWSLRPTNPDLSNSTPWTGSSDNSQQQQATKHGPTRDQARDLIMRKLPASSNGDYSLLQFGLETVTNLLSSRTADINNLKALLDKSLSDHRQVAVMKLEGSLKAYEINELNELLKWVVFAQRNTSLELLESAMSLLSGPGTLRFMTMHDTIQQKYSSIFLIMGGYVYLQKGIRPFLEKMDNPPTNSEAPSDTDGEDSTISMTITLRNVKRKVCAEFFWDLALKTYREGFFDADAMSSANRLATPSHDSICVKRIEAHHTIVQQAFRYFQQPRDDSTQKVGEYLVYWLPRHLELLRGEDREIDLTEAEQASIGKGLYTLFKDERILERHLASFSAAYWTAEEIDDLQKWVEDTTVMKQVERKWRSRMRREKTPISGFMSIFARHIVKGFVCRRTWPVGNAHTWIQSFMLADKADATVEVTEGGQYPVTDSNDEDTLRDLRYWIGVSSWCQKLLASEATCDSLWWERLADAADENWVYDDNDAIIALYRHAVNLPTPSWTCQRSLGKMYMRQNRHEQAVLQFDAALKTKTSEFTQSDHKELHLLLAECASDPGQADWHYTAATASDNAGTVFATPVQLSYFKKKLDSDDALSFLGTELNANGEVGGRRISEIMKRSAREYDHSAMIHRLFFVLKDDRDLFAKVVEVLHRATSIEPQDNPSEPQHDNTESREDPSESQDTADAHEVWGVLFNDMAIAAFYYEMVFSGERTPKDKWVPIRTAQETAQQLWERSYLSLDKAHSFNADMASRDAIGSLAKCLFQLMLHPEPNLCRVDELRQLAIRHSAFRLNPATIYLAAIYALNKNPEKSQAELWLRMVEALEILTDDTPYNDDDGFYTLHQVLHYHQDFEQAAIALSLRMVSGSERFKSVRCDGCRISLESTVLYKCVYCYPSRDFCWDCLQKLRKNPTSSFTLACICSPAHRWYKIPQQGANSYVGYMATTAPVPREIRSLPEGDYILEACYDSEEHGVYTGKTIDVEEWKRELAKAWNISLQDTN